MVSPAWRPHLPGLRSSIYTWYHHHTLQTLQNVQFFSLAKFFCCKLTPLLTFRVQQPASATVSILPVSRQLRLSLQQNSQQNSCRTASPPSVALVSCTLLNLTLIQTKHSLLSTQTPISNCSVFAPPTQHLMLPLPWIHKALPMSHTKQELAQITVFAV